MIIFMSMTLYRGLFKRNNQFPSYLICTVFLSFISRLDKKLSQMLRRSEISSEDGKTTSLDSFSAPSTTSSVAQTAPPRVTLSGPVTDLWNNVQTPSTSLYIAYRICTVYSYGCVNSMTQKTNNVEWYENQK